MAAVARDIPDLRLIVLDSVSRFRGGEENSNDDATRFVEAVESLREQTGAAIFSASRL
ncbi:MAG: AAA family ATPase [Halofilum sp. (in: g-proteobacteria)]|nr:AAA family ATPase [Halofilum sp. (in: g-proteobacteria)]